MQDSKTKYTVEINIQDANEEGVDSMFQNIREYFDDKLQPKASFMSSVLEPPSSVYSSTARSLASEDWNVRDIDGQSRPQVDIVSTTHMSKFRKDHKFDLLSWAKSVTSYKSKTDKKIDIKAMGPQKSKDKKVGPKSFSVCPSVIN